MNPFPRKNNPILGDHSFTAAHFLSAAANQPTKLLLVDDEPRMLASLQALLDRRHFDIDTAGSGADALTRLTATRYDLVLLDLSLEDMDGHHVMDFMNSYRIDTDVIVVSGNVRIDAAIGALRRGAHDFLRKPFSQEELFKTIDNVLTQRRLRQTNRDIAYQLELSERTYRYMVDASPDIIYMVEPEGRFTFVNDRACQMLGYERRELIGQHYSMLVHEDDFARARYAFNERRSGERASRDVELRMTCRPHTAHVETYNDTSMIVSLNAIGMHLERMDAGGTQYVGTYGIARDITARKQAEAVILHQAYHDVLTNLPNRLLFRDRLGQAILQSKRNQTELATMFIDLDRFKLVNDTLGHDKGDALLLQVTARLKSCLRKGDTLARQGGDEFTVVLPDLRSRDDARLVADKFLECLNAPFDLSGDEILISASIGIAVFPHDGETIDELLRHADIAMYQIKGQGKNGQAFYIDTMEDPSDQQSTLERSLRKALERDELQMVYQPQVDARSGRISGVEALMRWNHPTRGVLLPMEFLPFAEEHGLVLPIAQWMLDAACRDMRQWQAASGHAIRLSLNLSPAYLDHAGYADNIRDTLLRHEVDPTTIEVEISESICILHPERAIAQLRELGHLGVSVAIDDFGTGYSSLSYLHRFPIHTIKIDQTFVHQIVDAQGHYPVVLAMISISRGLKLHLVAEGVETAVQAEYLLANGCEMMQGHLFHRPMPVDALIAVLRTKPH